MRRLLPQTLAGQLLALILVALVAAQVFIVVVFTDDRAGAIREADRAGLLEGMVSVMRMLVLSPAAEREKLAAAATTQRIRYWTSTESAAPAPPGGAGFAAARLDRLFDLELREPPRIAFLADGRPAMAAPRDDDDQHRGRGRGRGERFAERWGERFDVLASVPFDDGTWLNVQTQIRAEPVPWPWPSILSAVLTALAIVAIVAVVTRRATRPLAALAGAAEAFGRGEAGAPLAEAGPAETRRLTAAFNRMQERLRRFVADRTRMLAAIGHDLRTPITSLKLRAELLDDEEAKEKMLATLDEMQRMTEATLAFAREDAAAEPQRIVDLDALIASLADDRAEMGEDVTFSGGTRVAYPCRPTALRRALGNLVDNAVRYGGRARIALAGTPAGPVVTVDDDGPGIPEAQIEEVFKPFVRLEGSRSRDTGGSGLGLSIARSIVLSHGGELTLSNRPGGGLRAEMRLPKAG